ncbi:hypothetical protein JL107_17630 [Nakamurella flavida]|uniref:Uncharacterized protein n=1 Tax=Nakamurella flavida TaxID=363630 RepID=A0A938YRU1_9ACTN|nr:hypothetical protein [Nakamurella flavida]MBM9478272.1 hypothetical protein [Nakamurella flavida]MDP9777557.1 hypothetical protein [Nakamurella flavida]
MKTLVDAYQLEAGLLEALIGFDDGVGAMPPAEVEQPAPPSSEDVSHGPVVDFPQCHDFVDHTGMGRDASVGEDVAGPGSEERFIGPLPGDPLVRSLERSTPVRTRWHDFVTHRPIILRPTVLPVLAIGSPDDLSAVHRHPVRRGRQRRGDPPPGGERIVRDREPTCSSS